MDTRIRDFADSTLMIGSLAVSPPIMLAPMAENTNWPFRLLALQYGAGLSFTEMVTTHPFSKLHKQCLRIARRGPGEYPLGLQVCGNEPELMEKCVANTCALGYELFDLNLGCPVRRMVSRDYGGGLSRYPERVAKVLEVIVRASTIPVTVKIRAGFDSNSINAVEIARIAEDCGVSMVTVHGRTVAQQYSGTADLGIIGRVKAALKIPVTGNGDIVDGPTAERMLRETGCDGIMIGRGTLGRPWVFRQIRDYLRTGVEAPPPGREEMLAVIRQHAGMLVDHFDARTAALHMRRYLCQYSRGLAHSTEFRRKCQLFSDFDTLESLLSDYPAEYLKRTRP